MRIIYIKPTTILLPINRYEVEGWRRRKEGGREGTNLMLGVKKAIRKKENKAQKDKQEPQRATP